jgi:Uma2 family endonuclease
MTVTQDTAPDLDVLFPIVNIESDEPPLESSLHLEQMLLLIKCLNWWWQDLIKFNNYFIAGNMSIYYSPQQIKTKDFRGPDFFLVLDKENKPRDSWVVWQEGGKYPNLIIELLSPSTATTDRTIKKQIYQDIFRTPEYFWFDPKTSEFAGFILLGGTYQPIEPNPQGLLWSQQLDLYLGVHEGKLRYFTAECQLIMTPEEYGIQAKEDAKQEKQRAERLAAKLRELNIDPDSL